VIAENSAAASYALVCQLRNPNDSGLESTPDDARTKTALPERFKDHMSAVEEGANGFGFWGAITFSFGSSIGTVTRLAGDVNNAYDVLSLVDALRDLIRAIDSKQPGTIRRCF
jgi:hypothetical protein